MWVRFFIVILVVYLAFKTFSWARRITSTRPSPDFRSESNGADAVNEMVRDPVCGLYVPRDEAVTFVANGTTVHFCSEDCRRKYLQGRG